METILSLARKVADEAEVFRATSWETPVAFEANRLKMLETKESTTVSLRIIKDGRIGFATSSRVDEPQALVDMAVETAEFGAAARFELPGKTTYPIVAAYDPDVESVPVEDMVALAESLIGAVRRHTPELVCEAGATKSVSTVSILNSKGGEMSYRSGSFVVGMEAMLIRDTDMLFVGDFEASCRPLRDVKPLADSVIEQLELAKRTATVSTGELPVLLTPKGVRNALFAPLAAAFNGKFIVEGASPLKGKQGQQLFDPRLSLWDDATLDYRPTSRPCDDEGVPSQKTPLIDKGVVGHFLYDLQTAARAGATSTASAHRGRRSMPAPSVTALVFDEGDTSFKDMVSDLKEGLVVEALIGAGQGNILGGDFSGNVLLGYRVENGEITGRVKDTMISGNIYDVLKGLVAVGDEARWVGGAVKAPALHLGRLSVAAKG
ncbi:MAG: TldD/PmbA family protein [Chloroflexota bacterium]|nr:TldD/PmbA family protein [Chloroflexota bacterium]